MMRRSSRRIVLATLIATATIGMTQPALGDGLRFAVQASDDAAMKAYVLDLAKVNGYLTAGEALVAARKTDPAVAADLRTMEEADADTVAQTRAALKARPRIVGIFQKAGLALDDIVLIPRVLLAAGMAAEFPAAAGAASAAQIAFVKQNPAVIDRFTKLNQALEAGGDGN
jgi:hypothetical protein